MLHIVSIIVIFVLNVTAVRSACPAGSFRAGEECELCAPGTYREDFQLDRECVNCPENKFSPVRGLKTSSLCMTCQPNEFSSPGSASCESCPKGQNRFRNTGCLYCGPGNYLSVYQHRNSPLQSNEKQSADCLRCPEYAITTSANLRKCQACRPGFRANNARTRCLRGGFCPLGEARYQVRSGGCFSCRMQPLTTYNVKMCGRTCAVRTAALKDNARRCHLCPKGTKWNSGESKSFGTQTCAKCPSGTTTNGRGKMFCRRNGASCPNGTFIDKDGDCDSCLPNEYYNSNRNRCVSCRTLDFGFKSITSNSSLPTSTDEFCVRRQCYPGQIRVNDGCRCPVGKILRNGRCTACPAGQAPPLNIESTNWGEKYQYRCEQCDEFSYRKGTWPECRACPPGTQSVTTNGKDCQKLPPCENGDVRTGRFFYNQVSGRTQCVHADSGCPGDLALERIINGFPEKAILCRNDEGFAQCRTGGSWYFDKDRSQCIDCTFNFVNGGFVKYENDIPQCVQCPPGTYKPESSNQCLNIPQGFLSSLTIPLYCPEGRFIDSNGICKICPQPDLLDHTAPSGCLFKTTPS